jgi:hypothetical protein
MLTEMTNTMVQRRNKNDLVYTTMSFPTKLHTMLQDSERLGFGHIVSWQPGGKSFKVVNADRFGMEIMRDYFNQTKFKSFQRQLNIYGFKRVHHGPNKGGYIHRYFSRETPELCDHIGRRHLKDFIGPDHKKDLQVEPIGLFKELSRSSTGDGDDKLEFEDSEVKTFYDFFYPDDVTEKNLVSSIFSEKDDEDFFTTTDLSAPHIFDDITVLGNDDLMLDAGFLSLLADETTSCQEESTADEDELESEHSFPFKLHLMLEHAKKENFQHIVSWVKDGSAFKVHSSQAFVEKVMPNYFDQTKYESFRRQLNLYGFRRVSRGVERGVITHPSFISGNRYLCGNVVRKTKEEAGNKS